MKTISATIDLDATPEQVWTVLTDTTEYSNWNPFITSFEGPLEVGGKLKVRIEPPEARPMPQGHRRSPDGGIGTGDKTLVSRGRHVPHVQGAVLARRQRSESRAS